MTTTHAMRKMMILFTAMALFTIPLMAAAGASSGQKGYGSLANTEWSPEISNEPEAVYGKLKARSRQVCGSSDLHIAGGLKESRKIKECFEGTLGAAVARLDDPEVSALHEQ